MDEYQTQTQEPNWNAWTMSTLGSVINAYVDRTVNRPQVVYDSTQAYGVGEDGQLYYMGQPSTRGQQSVQVGGNPLMMLLLVGALVLMVKK
jgi:hypothetical protein